MISKLRFSALYASALIAAYLAAVSALLLFSTSIDGISYPEWVKGKLILGLILLGVCPLLTFVGYRFYINHLPQDNSHRQVHAAALIGIPVFAFLAAAVPTFIHTHNWMYDLHLKRLEQIRRALDSGNHTIESERGRTSPNSR